MTLTTEQENILCISEDLANNEILKINAFAGCGKTFMLKQIACKMPYKRFLYLAFNRAIVDESSKSFPKNVTICTTHSLAYREIVKKTDSIIQDLKAPRISEIFNEKDLELCVETQKILNDFLNSDKKKIEDKSAAHSFAADIYMAMRNRQMPLTHSFYLKEFSLLKEKKVAKFDYILLDEAQDINAVTKDIFLSFNGSKILVGDTHQAIYGFRGNINLNDIKANYEEYLSGSFRCQQNIIDRANLILSSFKKEKKNMTSLASFSKDDTFAVITRTNSKIIENIADYDDEYKLLRTPESIFSYAFSIYSFLLGKFDEINHSFSWLKLFKNEDNLVEYIIKSNDIELKSTYNIAKRYNKALYPLFKKAKQFYKNKKGIFLLTAHTSKGLEFQKVELESDFANLKSLNLEDSLDIEEINLYYVATTRAKSEICDLSVNEELFDELNIDKT